MSFTRPQAVLALFAASISMCACRVEIFDHGCGVSNARIAGIFVK